MTTVMRMKPPSKKQNKGRSTSRSHSMVEILRAKTLRAVAFPGVRDRMPMPLVLMAEVALIVQRAVGVRDHFLGRVMDLLLVKVVLASARGSSRARRNRGQAKLLEAIPREGHP